ncbi:MAG: Nif3-like dinuclear metal center hexameric protein [bacterium]
MLLEKLLNIIEDNFPAASAMDEDKIGLQVQASRKKVEDLLIALEVNDAVLKEAGKLKCDSIITFHPLIYNPLESLNDNDRVPALCSELIRKSISLISIHTNFDCFFEGTSYILAQKLDLDVLDFLKPDGNFKDRGMGVIAKPKKKLSPEELIQQLHKICKSPIRFSTVKNIKSIRKVAIVAGSGTSFLNDALQSGADAFITADITYHRFHEVEGKMMLIDPGHYEMEQFVPEAIARFFKSTLNKNDYSTINVSKTVTNPVKYYPDTEKYNSLQKNNLLHNMMVV